MSMDTLSEVLRAVRLRSAVFFKIDACAPWAAETPAVRELAPHIAPAVEHVIEYHLVAAGSCWGGVIGEPPIRLTAGDVIVFPQGDAHVISSGPGMRAAPEQSPMRGYTQLPIVIRATMHGGGSGRTNLVCGFLGCDARPFNPLLAALPRMLHVPRRDDDDGVLEGLVKLALAESAAQREGGECMLARLSELMFIEVVRRYLARLPAENVGWLAGLRDEGVGRALAKLHERPTREWTLDDLAREIGMSRSALAERFTKFVGIPPMQYLARWRIQLASSWLSTTALTVAEIAERVGYGSEAALSRAYKRWVGVAPAEWRRGKRAGSAEPASVILTSGSCAPGGDRTSPGVTRGIEAPKDHQCATGAHGHFTGG
jgi:AraC-like DNA-binding protein